jgi:hypothetical protein
LFNVIFFLSKETFFFCNLKIFDFESEGRERERERSKKFVKKEIYFRVLLIFFVHFAVVSFSFSCEEKEEK